MSVVYVWNEDWPGPFAFALKHARPGSHQFGFITSKKSTLSSIVQRIINVSQGPGAIRLLRICAHGNSGFVQLGQAPGLTVTTATRLRPLRNYFSSEPDTAIEVHACGVASSTDIVKRDRSGSPVRRANNTLICIAGTGSPGSGENLLRAINHATGVPVIGAVDCQTADPNYAFEGVTWHVI